MGHMHNKIFISDSFDDSFMKSFFDNRDDEEVFHLWYEIFYVH